MYQKITRKKETDKPGKGYNLSTYSPSEAEIEATMLVQKDMLIGREILTRPWMYYNGRSILEEAEENQKRFNGYIPPKSDDPDESWRTNTVRPLTRNKAISIAAHVTARMLYPNVFAQNSKQEEDRIAAEVMKDTIEWAIDNSEYSMKFVGAVLGMLTDPVAILEVGYQEVMRNVKRKQADGSYKVEEIVDEFLSGFVQNYRQYNEVYITNPFERNIQKQRAVSVRTLIDYAEAEAKYGKHKNFKYVTKGARKVFDHVTKTFYEIADPDLVGDFVECVVYRNRYKDLELVFVNGVLCSEPDECISRNDKNYGLASGGYELLNNGNFFYYKSLVNKLSPDQDIIDVMYGMVMDGTFLALMPPQALFGSEEVNSPMIVPGAITSFTDKETKIENIGPKSDLRAGMQAINLLEKSMSESSQDQFQMGIVTPGERTAEEIKTLQENARTALGLFGKMIHDFVTQIGNIMVGDVIQYITIGQLEDIAGENAVMKYKTIVLDEKIVNGKKVSKKLRFTENGMENPTPTYKELFDRSLSLMDEEESLDDVVIYDINPKEFRNRKFLIRVNPDVLKEKSDDLEKALALEAYDRLIQSPVIASDRESMYAVTQDFLVDKYAPGEAHKYMPKKQEQMPQQGDQMQQAGAEAVAGGVPNQFNQKGVNTNLTQQITGSTSIKKLLGK